jgi:hypothetical protein
MSGNEAHVIPLGDLMEHEVSEECACVPRARIVALADGSDGWLLVHHSLDGREASERPVP